MQPYEFTPRHWPTPAEGQSREWSVQNGAGGYAGGSVGGAPARHHHALLAVSLCPPVQRVLVWQFLRMTLAGPDGTETPLTSLRFADGTCEDGGGALRRFVWDGLPHWEYESHGISITAELALPHEKNAAALLFSLCGGSEAVTLRLFPCLCWRNPSAGNTPESLAYTVTLVENGAVCVPAAAPEHRVRFGWQAEGAALTARREAYTPPPLALQTEEENGYTDPEPLHSDFVLELRLPANGQARLSLCCGVDLPEAEPLPNAAAAIGAERDRIAGVLAQCGFSDPAARRLAVAADQFFTRRQSTGGCTLLAGLPWFTDWGRDTMIAFEGCCLCTRRFDEARSILQTFARYERRGLVPNMFPDEGTPPIYNTADASLWYCVAVALYDRYTAGADEDFLRRELWPCVQAILAGYERGTDFSIGMDEADGLMRAGSGLDQITWMDVRVGEWVPTPRHGKPVEINALWYAALQNGASLAQHFGEDTAAAHYAALADRVRARFAEAFWCEKTGWLYDCLTEAGPDATLRPNQLLAASLWHYLPAGAPPLLDTGHCRKVVEAVQRELYAGPGIRTLPVWDKNYHGVYAGALHDRDAAYHQGTAWGWLLGEFLFAHAAAYPEAREERCALLAPALAAMETGGVNGMAEIFDGDAPHRSRGCFNQAWSVGEALAALCVLGLEQEARDEP